MQRLLAVILILLSPALSFSAEKYKVLFVIDGDTISIDYMNKPQRVKLIGIDSPESQSNDKALRDSRKQSKDVTRIVAQGKKASAFFRSVLRKGDYVTLEFDVQERDKYGRLLAYVYLSDGRILNELIVSSGYASLMTIPPNVKYKERLLKAYRDAREKDVGLWSNDGNKQ